MGSYQSEPSQPSVVHLSSNSSALSASAAPPQVCYRGFIRTRVVSRRRGHAQGRGRGDDAPSDFETRYLPFDG